MRNVLWIGGPPGSGKTSVARRLAKRHGLRLYSADTRTWVHRDRALAEGNPAARRWEALTPAERWERSTPAEMLEMSLHRERGAMVIDDLRSLPSAPLVVAEGSPLPASALSGGIGEPGRAVWLIPTTAFQEALLRERDASAGTIRLYRLLREVVEGEAAEHGAPVEIVDGSRDVTAMTEAVERRFAEAISAGPRAVSPAERRALVREANRAIVEQVRGYHARPWAEGNAESVVRAFGCECDDPWCDLEVLAPVPEADVGPVIAAPHRGRS